MNKNVIISVYDKTDLDIIAKFLIKKKFTIKLYDFEGNFKSN